jgi:hypothetical protein
VENRRRVVAFDAEGAPEWRDAGAYPTSKIVLDAPLFTQAGDFRITLRVEDQLGNFGTATATVTMP